MKLDKHTQLPADVLNYLKKIKGHPFAPVLVSLLEDGEWNSGPYKLGLANGAMFAVQSLILPAGQNILLLEIKDEPITEEEITPIQPVVLDQVKSDSETKAVKKSDDSSWED